MVTADEYQALEGKTIGKTYDPGYVILSYVISLCGAWTTVELLSLRTGSRGRYNWMLLVGAAVSMGAVAVWSMHYIGNYSIILGDGDPILQIVYGLTPTALSFFIPILVLLAAFWTVGADEANVTRLVLGGCLAGFAVCGMHYLAQSGISNYTCHFGLTYFIGAAIIAVTAATTALFLFFKLRSAWITAWWSRGVCAVILAIAVSGMHWTGSIGTNYTLNHRGTVPVASSSRFFTAMGVLVLSVGACTTLGGLAVFTALARIAAANKARQIVVATTVFDTNGRLMVKPDGTIPYRKITNSFIEGSSANDTFNINHPVFLWLFRTSRNWRPIKALTPAIRQNIDQHRETNNIKKGDNIPLMSEEGSPIENYSFIFRELFCLAASDMAADMELPLEKLGFLYDEIINTGEKEPQKHVLKNAWEGLTGKIKTQYNKALRRRVKIKIKRHHDEETAAADSATGQLLVLIRLANKKDADYMQSVGFRFAAISSVLGILTRSLQIKTEHLTEHLENLWDYACASRISEPGAHLGCFAIRASLRTGFDILVPRDAKNMLPSMQLPLDTLESWQLDYLKRLAGLSVNDCVRITSKDAKAKDSGEKVFANSLLVTIQALKEEFADPIFGEAVMIDQTIDVPCRPAKDSLPPGSSQMIVFRLTVPLHIRRAPGKKLVFTPFNLFKVQQRVYAKSNDLQVFGKAIFREFAPLLDDDLLPTEDEINEPIKQAGEMQPATKQPAAAVKQDEEQDKEPVKQLGSWGGWRLWDKTISHLAPVDTQITAGGHDLKHADSALANGILRQREVIIEIEDKPGESGPVGFEEVPSNFTTNIEHTTSPEQLRPEAYQTETPRGSSSSLPQQSIIPDLVTSAATGDESRHSRPMHGAATRTDLSDIPERPMGGRKSDDSHVSPRASVGGARSRAQTTASQKHLVPDMSAPNRQQTMSSSDLSPTASPTVRKRSVYTTENAPMIRPAETEKTSRVPATKESMKASRRSNKFTMLFGLFGLGRRGSSVEYSGIDMFGSTAGWAGSRGLGGKINYLLGRKKGVQQASSKEQKGHAKAEYIDTPSFADELFKIWAQSTHAPVH